MTKQEELDAELLRAAEVAKRVAPKLLGLPGVVAIGPGVKRRQGKPTGKAAVVITVRKKMSAADLAQRGYGPLPDRLEGYPVDVVEYKPPQENQELRRAIDAAMAIKERVSEEWLRQENVTGIGVGYKTRAGRPTDQIAIVITVQKKLPGAEVARRGSRRVPETIDGIPTDVIEAGPFTKHVSPSAPRGARKDPLAGGLAIGRASSPFHYGTLAAVVFDNANRAMALSNEHVLDGDIGETVHQPSPVTLSESLEVGFQLDVCNPLDFVRLDTPNTTAGTILAGAAAGALIAAALSDDIDPTRAGQEATTPPPGALTLEEYTKVRLDCPQWPIAGSPFKVTSDWKYERRTDQGTFSHSATWDRQNQHTLRYHRLFTDRRRYGTRDMVRLFGVLLPSEEKLRIGCKAYHCVALLSPTRLDQTHPVVLRSIREGDDEPQRRLDFLSLLGEMDLEEGEQELIRSELRRLCIYYGEFSAAGVPLGAWNHWMYVQTANTVRPGTDPLIAARTIGGLAVSRQYKAAIDVACGPFIFEDDGSFDIEPI